MANISAIKLPNGTTYNIKDNGALQLTGGQVTGPVTFGDSVSIDEATLGDLVVNGSASFTNNIQANTINGVTVGSSPKFTDTVTTVTTSGSGNAVTAISASNGAITATKGSTFLTGITSSQVTTALGYTPYNSTNPNGYTTNTGTVTKVTAGTGLSIGTTAGGNFTTSGTINHTNSVTAQTTQAVYPIKIDAQGHISAYGSAVTIPIVPSSTGSATTGITASTTATKTTLGTASSIYGVGSTTTTASKASGANGSASTWAFEEVSIPNVTAAGSASTWAFTGVTVANSISGAVDANDSTQLNITVGTTTVQSKSSGGNGTAPTLGTAIKVQSKKSGANGTAPSWSFTDVNVPIKNSTATSVPNVSVASATVSITDNGHTHTI